MTHQLSMRLRCICLLIFASVLASELGIEGAPVTEAVQLQLQARLFHSASGSFSLDVLAPGGPDLVNVVASADPSTATLVLVVVKLAPGTVLRSDAQVRVTAREQLQRSGGERVALDRSLSIGPVKRGGIIHLGFWLEGTGCRPLRLEARLAIPDQAVPISVAATLPFVCSE